MIARAVVLLSAAGAVAAAAGASPRGTVLPPSARSDYIEQCAGCHGIEGSSAPARLPELRARIGYFLCTPGGRSYIARLPNVVRAPVSDAQALADLLNYVVFDLGRGSAPRNARPYQADEVAAFIRNPLVKNSLVKERARVVDDVIRRCPGVPASLRDLSSTPLPSRL